MGARVIRRQALGSSPLAVSAKRQRALDAARDHAFQRVIWVAPRPEHRDFPAPGEVDEEFRQARKKRA